MNEIENTKRKLLYKLIEKLAEDGNLDYSQYRQLLDDICREYGIAEITGSMSGENQYDIVLYSLYDDRKAEYGDYISVKGKTGDNRTAYIKCKSVSGVKWDEETREDVRCICNLLYISTGKSRLAKIADKFYFHDIATGLKNLNALTILASKLISQDKITGYTIALLNIKGFNYVNRKVEFRNATKIFTLYGRHFERFLDDDEMIIRLGGDNFVVLFKKEKTDRILKEIGGVKISFEMGEVQTLFNLSARASVYAIDHKPENFGELMYKISSLMSYARYSAHSDIIIYTAENFREAVRLKSFSQLFDKAIQNHDFVVYYQPKVDIRTNEMYGAEALVRWQLDGNLLPPSMFIDALEREHLICDLDYYVLEETCANLRKWLDKGLNPVKISTNFSTEHLHDANFSNMISEIADKYNIDHALIEVELTESVDVEEQNKLLEFVTKIQMQGFSVAIDDFGTGYSSLHLLESLPVDVLKIDKAFVSSVECDGAQRKKIVLKNIILMSEELGIDVISEGVETSLQAEILKSMGCVKAQGFLYDRPLPAELFEKRICDVKYAVNI